MKRTHDKDEDDSPGTSVYNNDEENQFLMIKIRTTNKAFSWFLGKLVLTLLPILCVINDFNDFYC